MPRRPPPPNDLRRVPFLPLAARAAAAGDRVLRPPEPGEPHAYRPTSAEDREIYATPQWLGRYLGVSADAVSKWWQRGLTLDAAERACHAAGWHPTEIWADWVSVITSTIEDQEEASCPV
jgi:hypothetical protein